MSRGVTIRTLAGPLLRADRRGVAIARALLKHAPDPRWAQQIEEVRARTYARTDPLEDGGITVGEHGRISSKSPKACGFLYQLIRGLRPRSAIEMGTAVGISASYIAAALPADATLISLEGRQSAVDVARENLASLGLANRVDVRAGMFADTFLRALEDLEPVDFLFIDGHHEEEPTLRYFEESRSHLSERAVVLFDDIRWSDGMKRAWTRISTGPGQVVDLGSMGIWLARTR